MSERSIRRVTTHASRAFFLVCVPLAIGCTANLWGDERDDTPSAVAGSTAAGSGATGAGTAGSAGTSPLLHPIAPGPATLPHLTVKQYQNAVRRVFGSSVVIPELEVDNRPEFYAVIGAARQPLTETSISLFWEASKSIAQQVTTEPLLREKLISCPAAPSVDAACIAAFLSGTVVKLLRRPLSEEETEQYTELISSTARGNLWRGLRFGLTALLSSPAFLYRHERTHATSDVPDSVKFDDYALASRLSFLLLNEGPDEELLNRAAAGELADPSQLAAQVGRLYPAATTSGLSEFFHEYLELDAAGLLDFEGDVDEELGAAMREEVILLARDAIAPGADFRRLFTTRETYLNGPLAQLYGVAGPTGNELAPFTLTAGGRRAGLLTTGAFLTAEGAEDRTKPTNRGLYVQFRLMCTQIPDPPEDIPKLEDTGVDPVATSVRAVLELHQREPRCAACHALVDPIGIGMEDFDQFGRYRTTYPDGSLVDARSEWNGVPFSGAAELGELLGNDPRVAVCMTKQLFRYATARLETADGEAPLVEALTNRFADSGYSFRELVGALVSSASFRYAKRQAP